MTSIFISSTFEDMQAERDALQRITLPALAAEARRYGRQLSLADLRWGVNTAELESEEGSRKVLRACLQEIDRSRPYMIVLLGERYGWVPDEQLMRTFLGDEVNFRAAGGEDYSLLLKNVSKSVTELEIEYGALLQAGNCFFYFRDPLPESGMSAEQRAVYLPSGSEDRKKMEALKNRVENAGAGYRVRRYRADFDPGRGVTGVDGFARAVAEDLTEHFRLEWGEPVAEGGALGQAMSYRAEADSLSAVFAGRAETLGALEAFLEDEKGRVLVLSGEEGSGKTSLLLRLTTLLDARPDILAIPFLCGFDRNSVNASQLLRHFILSLEIRLHGEEPGWDEAGYAVKLSGYSLPELRAAAAGVAFHASKVKGEKVLLCIDAAERLSDAERDWIPAASDGSFKIIITLPGGYWEDSAHAGREGVSQLKIGALTDGDKREIVKQTLRRNHKEMLPEPVVAALLKKPQSGNTLYLALLLQRFVMFDRADFALIREDRLETEARGVKEDGQLAIIRYMNNVAKALPDALTDLAAELFSLAGSRISPPLAELLGSLLSGGRNGWREADLRGIAVEMGFVWNPIDYSLLRLYLAPFFAEKGDARIAFAHESLKKGVRRLANEAEERRAILCWLDKLPADDAVRIEEYPRQLALAGDGDGLGGYLSELMKPGAQAAARNAAVSELFIREDVDSRWLESAAADWAGGEAGRFVTEVAGPFLLRGMLRNGIARLSGMLQNWYLKGGRGENGDAGLLLAKSLLALGFAERSAELYRSLIADEAACPGAELLAAAAKAFDAAGEREEAADCGRRAAERFEADGKKYELIKTLIDLKGYMPGQSEALLDRAVSLADELREESDTPETALLCSEVYVEMAKWYVGDGNTLGARRFLMRPAMLQASLARQMDGPEPLLVRIGVTICMGDIERAAGDDFPAMLFYTEALGDLIRLTADTGSPSCRAALAGCWTKLIPTDGYEEYTRERCLKEARALWEELYAETGDAVYRRLIETTV